MSKMQTYYLSEKRSTRAGIIAIRRPSVSGERESNARDRRTMNWKGLRVLELVRASDPRMPADRMCRHVELLRRLRNSHEAAPWEQATTITLTEQYAKKNLTMVVRTMLVVPS